MKAEKLPVVRESELAEDGYVVHVEGPRMTVRVGDDDVRARRALSCLVTPELGDRVLLAQVRDGTWFVLAVLDRSEDGPVRVGTSDRSLSIEAADGRVDIVAPEGVGVATHGNLRVTSATAEVHTGAASMTFDTLTTLGRRALSHIKKSTVVGEVLETVADVVAERLKRSYRVVREIDQLRSGTIDHQADKALRVHAENAFITAAEVVKLDGENIHLG
jgi:hypothetical protein